jgi:cation diffusion facilitator CzcD-associated flavoprotein CzcO
MRPQVADRDVVVVGAGPYGLGAAALLRRAGVDVTVFGDLMSFWRGHMPAGMLLRSSAIDGCEIGEGTGALTLTGFSRATGTTVPNPIPVETFVEYGRWYQEVAVPDLDGRLVGRIDRRGGGFELELADGDVLTARRVIVAAGIDRFAYSPTSVAHLDPELASHSSDHPDLGVFAGKRVAVIGRGQSALESAALLAENGAEVELLVRGDVTRFLRGKRLREAFGPFSWLVYPPEDVGPPGINLVTARPNVLRRMPRSTQTAIGRRAIRPAGAVWLVPRVAGVRITLQVEVVSAEETEGRQVRLRLSDGSERTVDHVLAATGYRVDIAKYPFLAEPLLRQVAVVDGYPILADGFETSVPGLHFVGAPAAWSYGPLMRFVSGTWFTSRTLRDRIAGAVRAPVAA